MSFRIRIDPRRGLLLFFLFVLFFLAGSYLNPFARHFSRFFVSLIIISTIYTIICAINLRFFQDYSSNHPSKGDTIHYKTVIENPLPFPAPLIKIKFFPVNRGLTLIMDPVETVLTSRESQDFHYDIKLPYRGIYELGHEKLEIRDVYGLLTFELSAWHQTFYVYPHLINIHKEIKSGNSDLSKSCFYQSQQNTVSGLREIREYREGDAWNRIDWKKTAATGSPFIKEMDSESGRQVYIFLDKTPQPGPLKEKGEDTALEILLAALKFFLERRISAKTNAWPEEISSENQFYNFYRSTLSLNFNSDSSYIPLENSFRQIIIITSRPHYFVNEYHNHDNFRIIYNLASWEKEEKKQLSEKGRRLKNLYPDLTIIGNSGEIEDIAL